MPPAENPYAAPETPPERRGGIGRFVWPSLMAMLVGGELALCWYGPGLGIPLLMVTVPALIRAPQVVAARRRVEGKLDPLVPVDAFISSIAVVVVTALAGVIAFAAVCTPIGVVAASGGAFVAVIFAFGLGLVVGVAVFIRTGRKLWPPRVGGRRGGDGEEWVQR